MRLWNGSTFRRRKQIYVGDSWVDIETGRAAGNFAVGVLWGFRDEEELRAHHADAVITAAGQSC